MAKIGYSLIRDRRAVSPVVGAVLLLGIFVIALATYQAVVIPNQTAETEWDAYQGASNDLVDLHNNVETAALQDARTETAVRLGTTYRPRVLGLNPSPSSGVLETTDSSTLSLSNVRASSSEAENTRSFVSEHLDGGELETSHIVYNPQFHELEAQPIAIAPDGIARFTENRAIPLGGQRLMRGDRLTITTIVGDLAERAVSSNVFVEPVSAPAQTVSITGDDTDEPIELQYDPGPVDAQGWIESTLGQELEANPRVEGIDVAGDGDHVVIRLDPDRTYRLALSQVEVGAGDRDPTVAEPAPAYLVAASGNDQVVRPGQRATLSAQVRDAFNNPVSDASVEYEIVEGDGRLLDGDGEPVDSVDTTVTVDAGTDGHAPVTVVPLSGADDLVVEATVDDGDDLLRTTFDVQVSDAEGGISGPGSFFASISRSQPIGPDDRYGARFQLRNLDDSTPMTVMGISVDRASTDANHLRVTGGMTDPWDQQVRITEPPGEDTLITYRNPTQGTGTVSFGDVIDLRDSTYTEGGPAVIPPSERVAIDLWRFSDGGAPVDMRGAFVEVTIWFYMGDDPPSSWDPDDPEIESVTATIILF